MSTRYFNNKVELRIDQHTAYVSLSNERKLNALDLDLLEGLVQAAKFIKAQSGIRAVILQGAGANFSAGLDVQTVASGSKARLLKALFKIIRKRNLFQHCALVWRDLPQPVFAVLHGYCFGGGLQIALGADFRIAHPQAQLSIMETKWGLIPDMSALVTLPGQLRLDQAKLLTMSADVIDAKQALEVGLITAIESDPLAHAHSLIERISNRSPDAVAQTKHLYHKVWSNSSERKKLFWETWLQIKLLLGKNQKIAVKRELNKNADKKPEYLD